MATAYSGTALRRTTAGLFVGGALAFAAAATLSVVVLRTLVLPRWVGATGLVVSAVYLLNQGDVLATAVPGFPVWDLAGLLGSTGWGLWVVALGVAVLRRSAVPAAPDVVPATARRATALRG
jgi:hypothetical protein